MKTTIISCFLLLLISKSQAQDVTQRDSVTKIDGISIFKIGKPRKEIISLAEEKLKTKIFVINSSELDYDIRNEPSGKVLAILKPNPDMDFDYPYNYSFCPNAKVYYIKNYEVSGIKLKNIYLKFYNDTLVDFTCTGNDIISLALKKLYGAPELKKETENSNCAFDYTDKGFAKLNTKTYETWYNNDITCTHYSSNYYDASCALRYNEYIYLYAATTKKILDECDNSHKPNLTNKKDEKKLKNLKEF